MFAFSFKMTFDKVSNISTNCKNILAAIILFFFHHFAGAQVTSEWVSHELSTTNWKQNDWEGGKKFHSSLFCFTRAAEAKCFAIIIQRI